MDDLILYGLGISGFSRQNTETDIKLSNMTVGSNVVINSFNNIFFQYLLKILMASLASNGDPLTDIFSTVTLDMDETIKKIR